MTEATDLTLAAIATVVRAVSGIRQTSEPPNETQNVDPFVVVYYKTGRIGAGAEGTRKHLCNISVDLLIPQNDLARDIATLTPFIDTIPAALLGQISNSGARFSGTISTFGGVSIQYLGNVDYAGVPMRGYSFTMEEVKMLVNL